MSELTFKDLEKHAMSYATFKMLRGEQKRTVCREVKYLLDNKIVSHEDVVKVMGFSESEMFRFVKALKVYGENEDKPKTEKQPSKPKPKQQEKKQEPAATLAAKEPDQLTAAPEPQPSESIQEIKRLQDELAAMQQSNLDLLRAIESMQAAKEPTNVLMTYSAGGIFAADQVAQKIKKALLLIDNEPYQYKFSLSLEQVTDYIEEPEQEKEPQPEPLQNQLEPLRESIAYLTQRMESMKDAGANNQTLSIVEKALTAQQEELTTVLELLGAQDEEIKKLKEQQQNKNAMADWQNAYAAAGIKGGDVSEYEQANEDLKKKELTRENTKFEVIKNEPQFTDEHGRKVFFDPSTGDGTRIVRGITEYQAFIVCPSCNKKGRVWVGKGNKVINCNNPSCGEPMRKREADTVFPRDVYGNYFLGGKAKMMGTGGKYHAYNV